VPTAPRSMDVIWRTPPYPGVTVEHGQNRNQQVVDAKLEGSRLAVVGGTAETRKAGIEWAGRQLPRKSKATPEEGVALGPDWLMRGGSLLDFGSTNAYLRGRSSIFRVD